MSAALRRKTSRNSIQVQTHRIRGAFGHISLQQTDRQVFLQGTFHYTIRFLHLSVQIPLSERQKCCNLQIKIKLKTFLPEGNFANTVASDLSGCYIRLGVLNFGIAQVQNCAKNKPGKESQPKCTTCCFQF